MPESRNISYVALQHKIDVLYRQMLSGAYEIHIPGFAQLIDVHESTRVDLLNKAVREHDTDAIIENAAAVRFYRHLREQNTPWAQFKRRVKRIVFPWVLVPVLSELAVFYLWPFHHAGAMPGELAMFSPIIGLLCYCGLLSLTSKE